jgi:hypothetical protein
VRGVRKTLRISMSISFLLFSLRSSNLVHSLRIVQHHHGAPHILLEPFYQHPDRSVGVEELSQPSAATMSIVPQRRQVLPDVELLQGAADLDEWLVSIRAKLRIDGAAIGDEYARFHYVYSRLAPGPKRTMLPYVKRAQDNSDCAADAFVTHVQSTFEDPNKVKKAGQRLTRIRQGRRSIAAYVPEFERTLFEARADLWPDDARIILLAASLNQDTQDRLEGKDWPETYTQFTAFLRRQESAFVGTSASVSTVADNQSDDDRMEVDINRIRAPRKKTSKR